MKYYHQIHRLVRTALDPSHRNLDERKISVEKSVAHLVKKMREEGDTAAADQIQDIVDSFNDPMSFLRVLR